jgi:hypothetical protein
MEKGVPVADRRGDKEKSISAPKRVAAWFKESGEVAPVDLGRFGKRAGEIIARAARERSRAEHRLRRHRKPH